MQGQLEVRLQSQGFVHHLGGLQDVPLGQGPAWVGQHVGPVPQLVACGSAAQKELADGLILGHFVMIPDGDDHVHILGGGNTRKRVGGKGFAAVGTCSALGASGKPTWI